MLVFLILAKHGDENGNKCPRFGKQQCEYLLRSYDQLSSVGPKIGPE